MLAAGGADPCRHRGQEGPATAGRLDRDHRRQIPVRGVSGQVEDQLDDPTAGEDLAVLDGLRRDRRQRRQHLAEHQLPRLPRHRTHPTSIGQPTDNSGNASSGELRLCAPRPVQLELALVEAQHLLPIIAGRFGADFLNAEPDDRLKRRTLAREVYSRPGWRYMEVGRVIGASTERMPMVGNKSPIVGVSQGVVVGTSSNLVRSRVRLFGPNDVVLQADIKLQTIDGQQDGASSEGNGLDLTSCIPAARADDQDFGC